MVKEAFFPQVKAHLRMVYACGAWTNFFSIYIAISISLELVAY